MSDLNKMLAEIQSARFYGTLEVKFEAGIPTLIRKTETFKPTEKTYRSNGSQYGSTGSK